MRRFTKLNVCKWNGTLATNAAWASNRSISPVSWYNLVFDGRPMVYPSESEYLEYWAAIYHDEVVLCRFPASFTGELADQHIVRRWPVAGGPSSDQLSGELEVIFEAIFDELATNAPAEHYALGYMGHGAGQGGLFELQIKSPDAVKLLAYANAKLGKKLAFFDAGGNCAEGTLRTLQDLAPYCDYVLASEFLIGGRIKAGAVGYDATVSADHFYGDAIFMAPWILSQADKSVLEQVIEIADTKKAIWRDDEVSMSHYNIRQSISVYDGAQLVQFQARLAEALPRARTIDYEACRGTYANDLYGVSDEVYDVRRFLRQFGDAALLADYDRTLAYYLRSTNYDDFNGMVFMPFTMEQLAGIPTQTTEWDLEGSAAFQDFALVGDAKREVTIAVGLVANPGDRVIGIDRLVMGSRPEIATELSISWRDPGATHAVSHVMRPIPGTGTQLKQSTRGDLYDFKYDIFQGFLSYNLFSSEPYAMRCWGQFTIGSVTLTMSPSGGPDIRSANANVGFRLKSRRQVGAVTDIGLTGLTKLESLDALDVTATAVQFKNVATGQFIVLRPDPRGGGSLEGGGAPSPTPWYFYQAAGAERNNVEVKRKPVDGFNWSNYDLRTDEASFIAWNHAKRHPSAAAPSAPHDWFLEELGAGIFGIKWRNGESLQLMPDLRLFIRDSSGPKIISRATEVGNRYQQWEIWTNR